MSGRKRCVQMAISLFVEWEERELHKTMLKKVGKRQLHGMYVSRRLLYDIFWHLINGGPFGSITHFTLV